jgi:hypothetical protein
MRVTDKNVIWFARGHFKICINIHIIVAVVGALVTLDIVSVRRSVEKSFKKLTGGCRGGRGQAGNIASKGEEGVGMELDRIDVVSCEGFLIYDSWKASK